MTRKIVHIDMDYFFAAVEERENPNLKNRPFAIGGVTKRGVISTANYIARRFGVKSAIPSSKALELCPQLILLPPNINKYAAVAQNIKKIFYEYTDLVETLSLDEAFLDLSASKHYDGIATKIAYAIRAQIYAAENLTASAGISINKLLAKIASDWRKPNGQFTIAPHMIDSFVKKLPVDKLFGVGIKTAQKLHSMGVKSCEDLQAIKLTALQAVFGKFGVSLFEQCRGIDKREVNPNRQRKSFSVEHTFEYDLTAEYAMQELSKLLAALKMRLNKTADIYDKIFIKIKFHDFSSTTAETRSCDLNFDRVFALLQAGLSRHLGKRIRLLGVGVRLATDKLQQLELFE